MRRVLLAVGLVLTAGCLNNVSHEPPAIDVVTITASDVRPTRLSTFTCTVSVLDGGAALKPAFTWNVDGVAVPGATSPTLAGGFAKGQSVSCSATVSDGAQSVTASSRSILVLSALPTIAGVSVAGELACGVWTCSASDRHDADGDTVNLHYRWSVNGTDVVDATGAELPAGKVAGGQTITCAVWGDDGTVENGTLLRSPEVVSSAATAIDNAPVVTAQVTPAEIHPGDLVTCTASASDDCAASPAISVAWKVNDTVEPGATESTFPTASLHPGDTVSCAATASDGTHTNATTSNTVTLTNQPPQITAATLTASDLRPTLFSLLTCAAVGVNDADNDPVTTTYAWSVDGVPVPGATTDTLSLVFAKGQSVTCTITVADAWTSASATSSVMSILSTLPTIGKVSVSGELACGAWSCQASDVHDSDGDTVALHYRWSVDDAAVEGETGATLSSGNVSGGQMVKCAAWGDDGTSENGMALLGLETVSTAVTAVDNVPTVSAQVTPAVVHPGDVLTCGVSASDDCAANPFVSVTWMVNGAPVPGATAETFSTAPLNPGDTVSCSATASDGQNTASVSSNTVTLQNRAPQILLAELSSSDLRPTRSSIFTCSATGVVDPDGDPLTVTYAWQVDGVVVPGETSATLMSGFAKGQSVSCSVLVADAWTGASATSAAMQVLSVLPTVGSVAVSGELACGAWVCQAADVNDEDDDAVTLHYRWSVNGVDVPGPIGMTLPSGKVAGGQTVTCAAWGDDGTFENGSALFGLETNSQPVAAIDHPPIVASISLPSSGHPGDVLTCAPSTSDDCTATPTVSVTWKVNGAVAPGATAQTFSTSGLNPGDTVSCAVAANDGTQTSSVFSNTATLLNQPPQIATATVTTSDPRLTKFSILTCNAAGITDSDGDLVTTSYGWKVDGVAVSGATTNTLSMAFAKGQSVICTVIVADRWSSASITSASVRVQSALPTVGTVAVSGQLACGGWTCQASNVSDPDGDTVTRHYRWSVNGASVAGASGAILPSGKVSGGQSVSCAAWGDDGTVENGVLLLGLETVSPAVSAVDNPPTVSAQVTPVEAHPGDVLNCTASASDDCSASPAVSMKWKVNGAVVSGATAQTLSTSALNPGDTAVCVATANDGTNTASVTSNTVTFRKRPPQIAAAILTSSDSRPTKLSTFTCAGSGVVSPDGLAVTTSYAWQVNGAAVAGATSNTLTNAFSKGQSVSCTVIVSNSEGSASATSAAVVVKSALPTVASAAITGNGMCIPYVCNVTGVQDADGDLVTLRYRWLIDGVNQNVNSNTLTPGYANGPNESLVCVAYGDDGTVENNVHLYGADTASPGYVAGYTPLDIKTVITPGDGYVGDTLTCTETITTFRCDSTYHMSHTWMVNGVQTGTTTTNYNVASMTTTFSTAALNPGDVVTCVSTATAGGAGKQTFISNAVTMSTKTWNLTANVAKGSAGYSVAVIDDINNDGLREIAVGAPNSNIANANHAGALYLVRGRSDVASTPLQQVIDGTAGVYQAGEHGSFNAATMACNSTIIYPNPGCPLIRDVGEIIADIQGPDGAGLGYALAYAGDLDGDGKGDLIATAPYDQVGDMWTGRSYVLSGKSLFGRPFDDATAGLGGFVFDGECGRRRGLDLKTSRETGANGDLLGWRTVPIGDANGDGLADFAVSAPNSGDFDEGTVYVVFGRSDGKGVDAGDIFQRGCNMQTWALPGSASGTAGYAAYFPTTAPSSSAPPRWGKLLAPAGDFNGDGYDDVLVPSPGLSSTSNAAWLQLGGPNPGPRAFKSPNPLTQWEIQLGNFSISCNGSCVQKGMLGAGFPSGGGGDVNGDGFDDLAFDARDFDHNGIMNIIYGRSSASGPLTLYEAMDGSGRGFQVFGASGNVGIDLDSESGVAQIVGDLNGDGFDDIALGVPTQGTPDSGAVFVVFGAATPPVNLSLTQLRAGVGGFTLEPGVAGEKYGAALAAGDVDGDGLNDLVIGAPGANGSGGESGAGRVEVRFGRDFTKNVITYKGGPGNDTFTGTSAGESIVGGRGNDVLSGGGGADVIYGGAGDDTIQVSDNNFRRINGGAGSDTLVLGPGVSGFTMTGSQRRRIQEIERIQLQGQTVTLSKLGLVALSNTNHRLMLFGSGTVQIPPTDHWRSTGQANGTDGNVYRTLSDGQMQLWIATGLNTNIPPTIFDGPIVVAENSLVGMTLATLSATDPDGNDASLRWELVSDQSGAFGIDQSGHLAINHPMQLDYEGNEWPWNLTVRVTDGTGLQTQATFVVSLSDQPEPPEFKSEAPQWIVFEDTVGVLGNVLAVDPDAGDSITYSILYDPSGIFQIDPVTGDVSVKNGKGFNAVVSSYTVDIAATDTTGRMAEVTLIVDVLRRNPLTRTAHVTFELRDWSIYQDTKSSSFAGLQIPGFTDSQLSNTCVSQAQGNQVYAEPWTARVLNGVGPGSLPVEFDARYLGELCTNANFIYDSGTFNATVPYDVSFSYPEQLHAGDTFTFNSSAVPSYTGAALWGTSSGFQIGMGIQFKNFGIHLEVCDKLITGGCKVVADKQGVNGKYQSKFGMPPQKWTATPVTDPNRFAFTVPSPVKTSSKNLTINWDDSVFAVLSALGMPSNEGTYEMFVGGTKMKFDYTIFKTQIGFLANADWNYELAMSGVTATLTFENGSTLTFPLGSPKQITVPVNGDVNGDHRVDVSISLSLNSTFHDTWHHAESGGYFYSGGYGKFQAIDSIGKVLATRQVGPAMEEACVPKVDADGFDPMSCISTQATQNFDFTPTGFSKPVIQGGFNLAP